MNSRMWKSEDKSATKSSGAPSEPWMPLDGSIRKNVDPLTNRKPRLGSKDSKRNPNPSRQDPLQALAMHDVPRNNSNNSNNSNNNTNTNAFHPRPGMSPFSRKRLSDCKPLDEEMLVTLGGRPRSLRRRWSLDGSWWSHPRLGHMQPLPGMNRWEERGARPRCASVIGDEERDPERLRRLVDMERAHRRELQVQLGGMYLTCRELLDHVQGLQEMVGAMSAEMVGEEDLWGVDEEGRSRTQTPEREEGREGGDDRGRAHGRERLEHAEARALQAEAVVGELRRRLEEAESAAGEEVRRLKEEGHALTAKLKEVLARTSAAEQKAPPSAKTGVDARFVGSDSGVVKSMQAALAKLESEVAPLRERAEEAEAKWNAEREAGDLRKKLTSLQEERITAKEEEIERLKADGARLKAEAEKHRSRAVDFEMKLAVAEDIEAGEVKAKLEAQRKKLESACKERVAAKDEELAMLRSEVERLKEEAKGLKKAAEGEETKRQEELKALETESKELRTRVEKAEGLVAAADKEVQDLKKEEGEARARLKEAESEVKGLRREVEKGKEEAAKREKEMEEERREMEKSGGKEVKQRLEDAEKTLAELGGLLKQLVGEARKEEELRRDLDEAVEREREEVRRKVTELEHAQKRAEQAMEAAKQREVAERERADELKSMLTKREAEAVAESEEVKVLREEGNAMALELRLLRKTSTDIVDPEHAAEIEKVRAEAVAEERSRSTASRKVIGEAGAVLSGEVVPGLREMSATLVRLKVAAEEAAEREEKSKGGVRKAARETLDLLRRIRADDDMQDKELEHLAAAEEEARRQQRAPTPTAVGGGGRVSSPMPGGTGFGHGFEEDMRRMLADLLREGLLVRVAWAKVVSREQGAQKELEQLRKGIAGEGLVGKLNEAKKKLEKAKDEAKAEQKALQEEWEHKLRIAVMDAESASTGQRTHLQEELAVLYNNHGSALKKAGDLQRAEEMYKRAIQNRMAVGGEETVDLAPILINLAAVHLNQGHASEAEPLFARAYGPASPSLLPSYHAPPSFGSPSLPAPRLRCTLLLLLLLLFRLILHRGV